MSFLFSPPATVSVPVVGESRAFPVHRIYCVGRNYEEHAKEMGFTGREPVYDPMCGSGTFVIEAAEKMDIPLVNTFMGGDGALNQDQNWEEALRAWPDIVRFAQDHGRKITLENCPMLFSYDEWPGGNNIATSPRMS